MKPRTAIGSAEAPRNTSRSFALIERGRIFMRPPVGARRPEPADSGTGREEEEYCGDQKQPASPTKPLHKNRSSRRYSAEGLSGIRARIR